MDVRGIQRRWTNEKLLNGDFTVGKLLIQKHADEKSHPATYGRRTRKIFGIEMDSETNRHRRVIDSANGQNRKEYAKCFSTSVHYPPSSIPLTVFCSCA